MGGGRVEQASPWRAGNGEGDGCDADDGDSSNMMLSTVSVWTQAGYEVVRSSSK
jgi:hypothetical protein